MAKWGITIMMMLQLLASSASAENDSCEESLNSRKKPLPPRARIHAKSRRHHGQSSIDFYNWMRDDGVRAGRPIKKTVRKYIDLENAYTDAMTVPIASLQETFFLESQSRLIQESISPPIQIDDYLYYSKVNKGQEHRVHVRRKNSPNAPETILLDENQLRRGRPYLDVSDFEPSPDHRFIAYTVDYNGDSKYHLLIKDLQTGQTIDPNIHSIHDGITWGKDASTIFYHRFDDRQRPYQVWRHTIGEPKKDQLIYEDPQEDYFVGMGRSQSGRFLWIESKSHTTSEVSFLDLNNPEAGATVFYPRIDGIQYELLHEGNDFYIVTNDGAPDRAIHRCPIDQRARDQWTLILPGRPGGYIQEAQALDGYLVLVLLNQSFQELHTLRLSDLQQEQIPIDEKLVGITLREGNRYRYQSGAFQFGLTSFTHPGKVFERNLQTGQQAIVHSEDPPQFNPDAYDVRRIWVASRDGKSIPVSLVSKKGITLDGQNPLLMEGYGAYGINYEPGYSNALFSLIDRGMVYAIAHIRGSRTLGEEWYQDGKLLNKKNTFYDFIDVAQYFVREKWTSPDRFAIQGGSAGGLLMGVAMNLAPDLFQAVLAHVPFVDVVNTMLDPTLPLTIEEYNEWGNPNDPETYRYQSEYDPYQQTINRKYPHLLIDSGLHDSAVQYWEPLKWIAKLRAHHEGDSELLLRMRLDSGHGSLTGREERLVEAAFHYAWIWEKIKTDRP